MGIPTQCLKASKCRRGNAQYFANVLLKLLHPFVPVSIAYVFRVNPKLDGLNWKHDAKSVPLLSDPHRLTMVMGALSLVLSH